MNKNEIQFNGTAQRIYSGNYLIAKGYTGAVLGEKEIMISINECHIKAHGNMRYLRPFGPKEQYSSLYERYHHTSDIHAVVYKYHMNVGPYKKGMFYIQASNVDYFPHNRTDIKRNQPAGILRLSGPHSSKKPDLILCILGQRPRGVDPRNYDIENMSVYRPSTLFIQKVFEAAIEKYGREEVVLLTNGSIGFNQLAQKIALEMKISVWLHIPFVGFQNVWKKRERDRFDSLAERSFVTDLGQGYVPKDKIKCITNSCKMLVEKADHILTVYDGQRRDEVYYALAHAEQLKKRVTAIRPTFSLMENNWIRDYYSLKEDLK